MDEKERGGADAAEMVLEDGHVLSPPLSTIVRALATTLLAQSAADGEVLELEVRRIELLLRKIYYLTPGDVRRTVRQALKEGATLGELSVDNALTSLASRLTERQRERVIELLNEVGHSDGKLHVQELLFIRRVRERLGIPG